MAVTHKMMVRLATNQIRIERKLDLILRGIHPQLSMAGKNCVLCGQATELKVIDDLPALICGCDVPHVLDLDFVESLKQAGTPKRKEIEDASDYEPETENLLGAGRAAGFPGSGPAKNG